MGKGLVSLGTYVNLVILTLSYREVLMEQVEEVNKPAETFEERMARRSSCRRRTKKD